MIRIKKRARDHRFQNIAIKLVEISKQDLCATQNIVLKFTYFRFQIQECVTYLKQKRKKN